MNATDIANARGNLASMYPNAPDISDDSIKYCCQSIGNVAAYGHACCAPLLGAPPAPLSTRVATVNVTNFATVGMMDFLGTRHPSLKAVEQNPHTKSILEAIKTRLATYPALAVR